MPNCHYCNKKLDFLPFTCKFCKNNYCTKHRLPENHKCLGLAHFKEMKKKQFVERAAGIVKDINKPKKGFLDKAKGFFNNIFKR